MLDRLRAYFNGRDDIALERDLFPLGVDGIPDERQLAARYLREIDIAESDSDVEGMHRRERVADLDTNPAALPDEQAQLERPQ